MKKVKLLILLILGSGYFLYAQQKVVLNKNYIGFHIGGVESHINPKYNNEEILFEETAKITSITTGLSFKNYSEQIGLLRAGISIDLNYIQKGGYLDFNLDKDSIKTENVLHKYISNNIEFMPLMNISIGKKWFHLNVFAGPYASYVVSENLSIVHFDSDIYKNKADYKFDFGLDFGTGIDFEFGRSCVELRFLYGYGFTNIFKSEEINVDLWYNQNRVISGILYYYYKL